MVQAAANPSSSIYFRLLGPLTVTVDDQQVHLGGPRQMAVLARLMLTPDQVVTMNQLVESVWDGDEPAQPHVAVRSYISNLRRAIEPNRRRRSTDSCLASSSPGYRLAVDPESVDWVRFERLVHDGRRQLSAGDPSAAAATLRGARELWSGEPFPELPESYFFLAHRARLSELRDSAVELLFEALLAGGDHSSVAAEIESALTESPLRERLTELGMLALYRSGRQSEALALGQKLRSRLLDRLGVDPSPSIDTIELKILNHDSSLEQRVDVRPSPPAPAEQSDRAPAAGQKHGSAGDHRPPVPPSVDLRLGSTETVQPVGRGSELLTLGSIGTTIAAGRSITAVITGEQGIGKTTLARSVAEALTGEQVAVAWARCIGPRSAPLWPWAQAVLGLLGSFGDPLPLAVAADLTPLMALGPSVAGALGLQPTLPADQSTAEVQPAPVADRSTPPALAAIAPPSTDDGEHLSPRFEQAEIMLAVTRLLERLSSISPIVLIFEDLQWADQGTTSLLNYAASTLADRPVGFLLTWRETDLVNSQTTPGLREVSRLSNLIRIDLEGLDNPAVRELAQGVGRSLTPEETEDVRRRCDGNPMFVREVLAHVDMNLGDARRWSILVDAVLDRVERLHPLAASILAPASLFREPFTVEGLGPICDAPRQTVQQVLDAAVRGGVLHEEDPIAASYRFRHPVIAEVLSSRLLAGEQAAKHELIGHHLLRSSGPSCEVAHHLSQSRSAEDRLLAARSALARFEREGHCRNPNHLERYMTVGKAAVEQLQQAGGEPDPTGFNIDALSYTSWRCWVDGRPSEWMDVSRIWLQTAVDHCPASVGGRTVSRTKQSGKAVRPPSQAPSPESDPFERLEAAIMNMIGSPMQPVGPTETDRFVDSTADDIENLTEAIERLSGDSPARWAALIHLVYMDSLSKPVSSGQTKALREALKVAATARRRLRPEHIATVLKVLMARFCDTMDPTAKLAMLTDIGELEPGLPTELFHVRYGYPALLELGRCLDAERQTEALLNTASNNENPLLVAEARLMWIRHLLWTGQFDAASDEIDQALADWAGLGLADAVPFIRQRRTLRLLLRVPIGEGHGPDNHHQLMVDRAGPAELALRLARMGDHRRANEFIDAVMDRAAGRRLSLPDQALVAGASALVGHEKAALTVYELLVESGDRPIVRADGSVVFGPASLYAGLAARAIGNRKQAEQHFAAGQRAVQRFGGSPGSADLLVQELQGTSRSNQLPTNS